MNEIKIFENSQFGSIRTTTQNGNPWFVAVDLCKALEINNPRQAITRLDDDEKMTVTLNDGHSGKRGGARFQTFVSESGLYSLVLSSRKPEAHAFKRWITHDVLPSIRQSGLYATPETVNQLLQSPEALIHILAQLSSERSARIAAEHSVSTLSTQLADANTQLSQTCGHTVFVHDTDCQEQNVLSISQFAASWSSPSRPLTRASVFSALRTLGYIQPSSPLPTVHALNHGILVIVEHRTASSAYYTSGITTAGQLTLMCDLDLI